MQTSFWSDSFINEALRLEPLYKFNNTFHQISNSNIEKRVRETQKVMQYPLAHTGTIFKNAKKISYRTIFSWLIIGEKVNTNNFVISSIPIFQTAKNIKDLELSSIPRVFLCIVRRRTFTHFWHFKTRRKDRYIELRQTLWSAMRKFFNKNSHDALCNIYFFLKQKFLQHKKAPSSRIFDSARQLFFHKKINLPL